MSIEAVNEKLSELTGKLAVSKQRLEDFGSVIEPLLDELLRDVIGEQVDQYNPYDQVFTEQLLSYVDVELETAERELASTETKFSHLFEEFYEDVEEIEKALNE